MTDEDVIQRRLLIDGDGTGDDRRLNLLLKSFIKWASSNPTPAESQVAQDRMLAQLAQCEYAFSKSRMVAKANTAQIQINENLATEISQDIEKAKEDIGKTKVELEEAKVVHSNRVEYEVLVNAIKEQPSRKVTNEKLTQLKEELHALEEKRNKLNSKLDIRRSQCHILMASIQQLGSLLENDESKIDSTGGMLDDFDDEDLDILSRTPESNQMDES